MLWQEAMEYQELQD
jgi:hypothetical protein